MELDGTSMEVKAVLSYTELKANLAKGLGRQDVPTSTLSRWMAQLGYPKGTPGRKRQWDLEDLGFIGCYASALSWGYSQAEAKGYAARQLEKGKNDGSYTRAN